MGYRTSYSLTVKGEKMTKEVCDAMNAWLGEWRIIGWGLGKGFLRDGCYADFSSLAPVSWSRHHEDMLEMSREFPDFVFELHGEGEETGDLWNAYFHNGEMEWCRAEIVYPKPQEIKWE